MPRPTQVTPARKVLLQVVLWGSVVVGLLIAAGAKYAIQDRYRLRFAPVATTSTLEYRLPAGWDVQSTIGTSSVIIVAHEPNGQKRRLTIRHWRSPEAIDADDASVQDRIWNANELAESAYPLIEGDFVGYGTVVTIPSRNHQSNEASFTMGYTAIGILPDGSPVEIVLEVVGPRNLNAREATILLHDIVRSLHSKQNNFQFPQLQDLVGQETI